MSFENVPTGAWYGTRKLSTAGSPDGVSWMFVTQTDMDLGNDGPPLVEAALRRV